SGRRVQAEVTSSEPAYDVVVVGSGAAGLAAAATAAARGLRTLIVEKTRYWGGTTAYSGGGIWIPNNPLMVADRAGDSLEQALAYLDAIVGDVGPASSHERRLAYLRHGPEMIRFLIGEGLRFERTPRYPDYYPEKPGGRVGRQLEPALVDGRRLGPLLDTLRMPAGGGQIVTRIGEFDRLILAFRT